MTAYGYIRKSVVHDPTRTLSPEMQEAAIRALAKRYGDEDVTILSDLDVSGTKDRTKRRGWDEVLRAVEEGEATAVYAYSLSRFARSTQQLLAFFDLCRDRKVPIRMERDQIDTSTAMGKMVGTILGAIVTMEADIASERVRDAFAVKRRRDPSWRGPGNLNYGELEGEDTGPVVQAFREAGSFDGAARLLNQRGVPTRGKGRAVWHGTSVAAVVRRVAPDDVAPATSRGVKAGKRSFRLARVLACGTCGTRLTASLDKRQNLVRYYCHRAKVTPHARGWVTEPKIMRQVAAEAEHAAVRIRRLMVGSVEDQSMRDALAAKRARIIDMAADGVIDKADRDRRLAEVAEHESRLSARRAIKRITVPPDIEQGNPVAVNRYLSSLFDRIVVDMSKVARPGPSQPALGLAFYWRDEAFRTDAVATA